MENEDDNDNDSIDAYLNLLNQNKEVNENEECKQPQASSNSSVESTGDNNTIQPPITKAKSRIRKSRIRLDEGKPVEEKIHEILNRPGVLASQGCNYDESDDSFRHNHRILWEAIFRWKPLNLDDVGTVSYRQILLKKRLIYFIINLLYQSTPL